MRARTQWVRTWRYLSRPLNGPDGSLNRSLFVKGFDVSTTINLLTRWKEVMHLGNDSEAARKLGLRPSAIANWKNGTSHANAQSAERMAEDCGIPVLPILAAIEADRAANAETRRVWARYGRGAFVGFLVALPKGPKRRRDGPGAHQRNRAPTNGATHSEGF